MELKTYLLILLRKWWLVLPIFLVTLTTASVITYTQTPVYSATTTFIVAPSSSFGDVRSYATGLNILSNREEIIATYTEVAASRKIKEIAAESIGLKSTTGYSVTSDLIKGTTVLKITAAGPDPVVARDLANAVGTATVEYVRELYEAYQLSLLDEAKTPRSPASPDRILNISLGATLGLVLGGGIAFLLTYLEPSLESIVDVNIIDAKTGVYNRQYFLQRLGQEMVRARRNRYPLSVALMRIDKLNMLRGFNASRVRGDVLRHIAVLAKQFIREEDLIAYLGGDVFAFLLPDTPGRDAQAMMEYLQTRIAWTPFHSDIADVKLNLNGIVGVADYNYNGTGLEQLIDMATQALKRAEVSQEGKVYLVTGTNS